MGKISLCVNMEFVRTEDKPFEWGIEKAAELGYDYVEPPLAESMEPSNDFLNQP